ncbi:MAG: CrcB family protein [Acidimicrobiia bacterium]|jgi:CrcB protein
MTFVVLSIAGSVGAAARYLVSGWVQTWGRSDFPWGTLVVNLAGAFALGLVVGLDNLESGFVVAVVGFLGGFTTFSTWMVETIRLGPWSARAAWNLTMPLLGGVAAAALGYTLTG